MSHIHLMNRFQAPSNVKVQFTLLRGKVFVIVLELHLVLQIFAKIPIGTLEHKKRDSWRVSLWIL